MRTEAQGVSAQSVIQPRLRAVIERARALGRVDDRKGGHALGFDLGETHDWIVSILQSRRSVADSMATLIDRCETANPHSDWAALRTLPYGDTQQLLEWLVRPFRDEPSASPLAGLWFGLFNPIRDRHAVADIYVSGSERFEPDPNDNSWAVRPKWWPESRYAHSALLAEVYRIAYRPDAPTAYEDKWLGNDAEYPIVLGYGAFAVRELLERLEPSLVLGRSDSLGIAVGFDSGDFVLLGRLTRGGMVAVD
jgi:hypothetical protein